MWFRNSSAVLIANALRLLVVAESRSKNSFTCGSPWATRVEVVLAARFSLLVSLVASPSRRHAVPTDVDPRQTTR